MYGILRLTEGDFAPLELKVPENNMFNAAYPAPTFMYGTGLILLSDIVMKALSRVTIRWSGPVKNKVPVNVEVSAPAAQLGRYGAQA